MVLEIGEFPGIFEIFSEENVGVDGGEQGSRFVVNLIGPFSGCACFSGGD